MQLGSGAGMAAALVALIGCDARPPSLTVRVQSGLRAGPEASWVEVLHYPGGARCEGAEGDRAGRELTTADQSDLGAGRITAAVFGDLSPGPHAVRVRLRRPVAGGLPDAGPVLVERCVATTVRADRVLPVELSTSCLGVSCPLAGGTPGYDSCLEGRCVDPRCDSEDPSTAPFCCDRALLGDACDLEPTLCTADGDCDPSADCAGAPRCVGRVCVEADEDRCPGEAWCDHATGECSSGGIVDDAGMLDAAIVLEDASTLDTGTLDTGTLDTGTLDTGTSDGSDAGVSDANLPDARSATDAALDACAPSTEECNGLDDDCNGVVDEGCRAPVHRGIRMTPVLSYRYSMDLELLMRDGYTLDRGSRFHLYVSPTGAANVPFYDCQFTDGSSRLTRSASCDGVPGALPAIRIGFGADPAAAPLDGCRNLVVASRDNGAPIAFSYFHAHPRVSPDGPTGGRWGDEDQTPPTARTICAWDTGTL